MARMDLDVPGSIRAICVFRPAFGIWNPIGGRGRIICGDLCVSVIDDLHARGPETVPTAGCSLHATRRGRMASTQRDAEGRDAADEGQAPRRHRRLLPLPSPPDL